MTPLLLAFPQLQNSGTKILDYVMSSFFLLDCLLNFITAYFDEDYQIVDSFKVLLKQIINFYLDYFKRVFERVVRDRFLLKLACWCIRGLCRRQLSSQICKSWESLQDYEAIQTSQSIQINADEGQVIYTLQLHSQNINRLTAHNDHAVPIFHHAAHCCMSLVRTFGLDK